MILHLVEIAEPPVGGFCHCTILCFLFIYICAHWDSCEEGGFLINSLDDKFNLIIIFRNGDSIQLGEVQIILSTL